MEIISNLIEIKMDEEERNTSSEKSAIRGSKKENLWQELLFWDKDFYWDVGKDFNASIQKHVRSFMVDELIKKKVTENYFNFCWKNKDKNARNSFIK